MPPVAPYPLVSSIMDAARMRINDMIISTAGETLTDNAPFTPSMLNVAYQSMQQQLVSLGYATVTDSVVISGLPAVSTLDQNVEVSLSWTGYDNGSGTLNTAFVLPQKLIRPMAEGLEERQSVPGGPPGSTKRMSPMDEIVGSLAHVDKGIWNRQWQWRGDAIAMIGSRVTTDLRIRFYSYFPDLDPESTSQTVPIMRCEDALSGYVSVEFARGRGDMDMQTLLAQAQGATMILAGIDPGDTRIGKSSEREKMRDKYSNPAAVGA